MLAEKERKGCQSQGLVPLTWDIEKGLPNRGKAVSELRLLVNRVGETEQKRFGKEIYALRGSVPISDG